MWVFIPTAPFSVGDGIGTPQDHIDFVLKNGGDGLALTDHGQMNGFSHQYLHAKKLIDKGVNFKPIYGVEAYFIPSLSEWQKLKQDSDARKEAEKAAKKSGKNKTEEDAIGDELAATKEQLEALAGTVADKPEVGEDEEGGTVVENETESKSSAAKYQDPIQRRNHLVLLAKNSEGLKTLFKLVSSSFIEGFYRYPRIDLDILRKEAKGNLIGLTACVAGVPSHIIARHQTDPDYEKWAPSNHAFEEIQGELKEMVSQFKDALGEENYYLEMQWNRLAFQHLTNYHLIEASKRTGTPLVVTCDAHYSNPEHWRERELYKAMAWASKSKGNVDSSKLPQKIEELKCELYPKNAEQVWDSYKHYSAEYPGIYDDQIVADAIERTWSIAHEQIGSVQADKSVKLPVITKLVPKHQIEMHLEKLGEGTDDDTLAFEELKRLAKEGMMRRKRHKDDVYIQRLVHELGVIKHLKFAKYFLTYAKIMEIASKHLLVGSARGSAGGSLLSYVLNITQVDPIRFGLLFERFLVRNKKGYPDIDSDFSDRDKTVKLIAEYFGQENVIAVSNFNQLQLRSLIKDVAKAAGIPFEEINKYTIQIENEALEKAKGTPGFDRAQWVLTYEEAEKNSETFQKLMVEHPEFEKIIKVLFKQMRNISRHAGGVIITENPRENMPIVKSGNVLQTPWPEGLNARHLEDFGFLKFDILGIGTLRMFEECIRKIIKKKTKSKYVTFDMVKRWYEENLHPDVNPLTDPEVYKHVFHEGHYAGVFQFVKKDVQDFIAQMKPTCINDLAIATSLYRPGPLGIETEMGKGAHRLYLENRKSPGSIRYKHPLLEEALSDTSGLIVFQEQLQLIYHKLAGVPLDETDAVRKAFTKKDLSNKEKAAKEREAMREDFAEKCLSANQIPKETSYSIFDELEKFVAYSFNKSHAVAYAIMSWQCAWFLTYYPDEWITTYIDYCATEKGKASGKEDPKAVAISEAKTLGYKIGKPDINLSERESIVKDGTIIPAFTSLKNIGVSALGEIIENRPYKTLEDLLFTPANTWKHSKFNKRALGNLIKLQGLESMNLVGEGKQFENYRQLYYVLVEKGDELKRAVSKKKQTHKEDLLKFIEEGRLLDDWSFEEKVNFSAELSGTVDLGLIVTPEVEEYFRTAGIPSIDSWEYEGQTVWCIIKTCLEAKTKHGKPYMKAKVHGVEGAAYSLSCWNFNPKKDRLLAANTLIIGKFKKNEYGFSGFFGGLETISHDSQKI